MTITSPGLRLLAVATLVTGTILLAGCGNSERVSKTVTTEQTTTTPPPVTSSTTTTTTRQSQP